MLCYTCDVSCEASASGDDCKADFVCEDNFAWFHHFGSCGAPKVTQCTLRNLLNIRKFLTNNG